MEIENIALFDMDGTLCDHDKILKEELEKIKSPSDETYDSLFGGGIPEYIQNRGDLIRSSESFWENLPRFKLGWDILEVAKELGYKIMILTQGLRKNPLAWSGKKKWIDRELGENVDITLTRDKGLVYGKILVDDYPEYVKKWLVHRHRGLVIMPANSQNKNFKHPQVIRYDGSNLEEVKAAMERVKLK